MYTTQNCNIADFVTQTVYGSHQPGFITNAQPSAVCSGTMGLSLDGLSEYLQNNPVYLNSILDGITLVRGLSLGPDEYLDCHYALLLRDQVAIDLVCLNVEGETDSLFDGEYLPANMLNTRYLTTYLAETNATSVLLLSTRCTTANTFSSSDLAFIQMLYGTLCLSGVNLLDWLTIVLGENHSWRWQCDINSLAYSGIGEQQFTDHGTRYALSDRIPVANA